MKNLISIVVAGLVSLSSVPVLADDHAGANSANWIVNIGEGISQTAHICTLKDGASMADIARIDKKLHKFMDDNDLKGFRQILTPIFAAGATYDYIAFDFFAWDQFGKEWDLWLASKTGSVIAAEYNKYEDCDAIVAATFPLLRRPEISSDDSRIVTVEWCTRKNGVSQDQLSAKHQQIAAANSNNTMVGWWGVGYPQAGARDGLFPGNFYHLVNYADMAAFAASKNAIANEEGWRSRGDYYTSYADCTGEHVFSGESVRQYR
jgi:hypothetical protein